MIRLKAKSYQALLRERGRAEWDDARVRASAPPAALTVSAHDADTLEASLSEADLVICQTGCISHGAYWRVQDHCRRTGKACVLVAQPEALRIVRIDTVPQAQPTARSEAEGRPAT